MPLPHPGIINGTPSNSEGETPSEPETEGEAPAAPEQQPELLPENEPTAQPEATPEVPMAELTAAAPAANNIATIDGKPCPNVEELQNQISGLTGEHTVALQESVTFSSLLVIPEDLTLTLDLGDHELKLIGRDFIDDVEGRKISKIASLHNQGTLTVQNGTLVSTQSNTSIVNHGTLLLLDDLVVQTGGPALVNFGGDLTTSADITAAGSKGTDGKVTVKSDCIVTYSGSVSILSGTLDATSHEGSVLCIFNRGYNNSSASTEVTVSSGTLNSWHYTASTNNTVSNQCNLTITGGVLNSYLSSIYWPSAGSLTIGADDGAGPEITATNGSAIEICSGSLRVLGGKLTGGTNHTDKDSIKTDSSWVNAFRNNSGASNIGDGVTVIARRNNGYTDAPMDISISGGEMTGVQNYGLRNMDCNTAEGAKQLDQEVSLQVSDGVFRGKIAGVDAEFSAETEKHFISGGTYSQEVANSYLAPGYACKKSGSGFIVVDEGSDVVVDAEPSAPLDSVEALPESAPEEVKDTFNEAKTDLLSNDNPAATTAPEGLEHAVMPEKAIEFAKENGFATIEVVLSSTLEKIEAEEITNTDGSKSAVITSVQFDVEPKWKVGSETGPITDLGGKSVTFRLPIPKSVTERYARVRHPGDADRYLEIQKAEDGQQFIELTADHFNPFTITFTNKLPSSGSSSSSDGGKSFAQRNSDFWEEVRQSIEDAKDGDVIKVNVQQNKCFVGVKDGEIVSAALVEDPANKKADVQDYVKAGGLSLVFPVGLSKILNFFHFSEYARADCDKKYPSAWYLEVLAVDDSMKGCGLGSGMLQDCLILYVQHQGGQELTLITNTEENCKFYQKNGFRNFAERMLEQNGQQIDNWSFCMDLS